ncbi:hypothetical protein MJM28_28770, partial [Salmonella enterica subsp. enterica serovar Montevideo]|nr:hypothetical protein [Salmonella enterica subsp. enterica serovar Montevideo]
NYQRHYIKITRLLEKLNRDYAHRIPIYPEFRQQITWEALRVCSKSISLTGFFLALITFGKLIFLGVFRRRSVVSTAGRDKFNVS